jgi:hypothetical protein
MKILILVGLFIIGWELTWGMWAWKLFGGKTVGSQKDNA